MRRHLLTVSAVIALAGSAAIAQPKYEPVDAALLKPRDGLGHFFKKLEAGKPVKIAYLGGSITAAGNGWRDKTLNWFRSQYPKATIDQVHAAIGGTGSDLGVFRLHHDALQHDPDLLFVEFSVNDGGAAPERIWAAMEGIVRQTWKKDPSTDICFVYTFRENYEKDLTTGKCPRAAGADEMVADHYGIPSINMALRVTQLLDEGKLTIREPAEGKILFSNDGVHPIEAGHDIYLDVIADGMQKMAASAQPVDHAAKLAHPFVEDNMEEAKIVPIAPSMLSGEWTKLPTDKGLGRSFGNRLGDIWEADTPGEKISFAFKGSYVALYDLLGPDGGQVTITVDGKSRGPVARFDHYCTYHRIATLVVARELDPNAVHHVTVEVAPGQPDRTPASSREKNPDQVPAGKYDGTNLRTGGIMIIGEMVSE